MKEREVEQFSIIGGGLGKSANVNQTGTVQSCIWNKKVCPHK